MEQLLISRLSDNRDTPVQVRGAASDAATIARLCARDMSAFEELYLDYHPRLSRFLMNLLRRPQVVEEVLDDTLLVVWTRADSFRGQSKLSTWIFGIAYRKAMQALRRLDEPIDDPAAADHISPDAGPDRRIGEQRVHDALLKAMSALSPDHRAVVDLTYFHELGYREIAEIVECPVDTVKTRMFHARRRLRQMLGGELGDWLQD